MNRGIGYWSRPFAGVSPSGDGWLAVKVGGIHRLMLADGIGHGIHAHHIVCLLQQQLLWICTRSTQLLGLDESLQTLHWLLRQQSMDCQAAVALVDLDMEALQFQGISIGNIQAHFYAKGRHGSLPMIHGMVGGRFPRHVSSTKHAIDSEGVLALFTDGIDAPAATHYLQALCALQARPCINPQVESETIVSRFGCISDDASCGLVAVSQLAP